MRYLITLLLLSFTALSYSQAQPTPGKNSPTAFGLSAQFYPAGIIATLDMDKSLNTKSSMFYRAGVNLIERKDFSTYNDHESGFGIGASAGYRKHFFLKKGQIITSFNTDVWNEWIHWENNIGQPNETTGKTYTLVLQPWLETGYFTNGNRSSLQYGLTAGFGREINVITDGNKVAQGWILSLLLHFQYTFTTHS